MILVVLIAIGAIGFLGWKYWDAQRMISNIKNKEELSKQEIEQVTKAVGALIILPQETPTIATVTDKSKLMKNDFFNKAENGDKVLIYAEARRAYLYRPGSKQLVDVTPLNIQQDATGSAQTETKTQTKQSNLSTDVTLFNGTTTSGLTNQYEQKLKQNFPGVTVAKKQNAAQTNYTESILVDVTGDNSELAKQLGLQLGLKVQSLPAGETAPESSLLIILGSDAL